MTSEIESQPETKTISNEQLFGELNDHICFAANYGVSLTKTHPSRELSLVLTKLEEAVLWLTKVKR